MEDAPKKHPTTRKRKSMSNAIKDIAIVKGHPKTHPTSRRRKSIGSLITDTATMEDAPKTPNNQKKEIYE